MNDAVIDDFQCRDAGCHSLDAMPQYNSSKEPGMHAVSKMALRKICRPWRSIRVSDLGQAVTHQDSTLDTTAGPEVSDH